MNKSKNKKGHEILGGSHDLEIITNNNLKIDSIQKSLRTQAINEPIFIISVGFGYNLVKRLGNDPIFEIWQGTGSSRDFLHRFNSFSDAVKFLLKGGFCSHYRQAINLLNKGGSNEK